MNKIGTQEEYFYSFFMETFIRCTPEQKIDNKKKTAIKKIRINKKKQINKKNRIYPKF